ncbi:MAG: formylglycine-generating enzyme family protein [Candidatus Eisenbacteria bacterium]
MGVRRQCAAVFAAALIFVACSEDTLPPEKPGEEIPAPQWPYVASTDTSGILLHWTDVTSGDAGFVIRRGTSSAALAPIDTTVADAEEYFDSDVAAGTTYYYRIDARDPIGRLSAPAASPVLWCVAAVNQTPQTPSDPYPPTRSVDLEIPALLTLTWQGEDPDGGDLARVLYFGASRAELEAVATDLSENSHALAQQLENSLFYFWRVRFTDDHGATALSPIWSFGTKIERLDVPEGYFIRGDCGTFHTADPQRFCFSENPLFVSTFNMDRYEVSNQLYAQFLNELLEDKRIDVIDGEVRALVLDTLFARVFPDGDEHSGIVYSGEEAGGTAFVPRPGRENHPVVEVTWHGAQRFARYYHRRLPTEEEWEKAARGTDNSLGEFTHIVEGETTLIGLGYPYPWGAQPAGNRFNYDRSGDPFESSVAISTSPAGYYDGTSHGDYATQSNSSPYGILDLAGNAAEWCSSEFIPYQGGEYGDLMVVKGGGWRSQPHWCQTFWRQEMNPDSCDNLVGFRTVGP